MQCDFAFAHRPPGCYHRHTMIVESWSPPALLGLGLAFGLKHALDADHLAAVATLTSESRTLRQSSFIGAVWGLGHTAALLAAGIVVLFLDLQISPQLTALLELGVAAMLIGLGGRALWRMLRGGWLHVHLHRHGGRVHLHPHVHAPGEPAHVQQDHHGRSFAIGVVHGLAGSGALMLLVAASTPSPWLGLAYIASFGLGSIGGMITMSALVSLPALATTERFSNLNWAVRCIAGLLSIAAGAGLGYDVWSGTGWDS